MNRRTPPEGAKRVTKETKFHVEHAEIKDRLAAGETVRAQSLQFKQLGPNEFAITGYSPAIAGGDGCVCVCVVPGWHSIECDAVGDCDDCSMWFFNNEVERYCSSVVIPP
jgi:hypothetical protein